MLKASPCFITLFKKVSSHPINGAVYTLFRTNLFIFNPVVVFQTNPVPALLGTINKEETMRTSTKNPSEMTCNERIEEIANILARAVKRSINKGFKRSSSGLRSSSKRSCHEQKSS